MFNNNNNSTSTNLFGNSNNTNTNLFGNNSNTNNTTNLFGNTNNASTNNTSTNIFGNNNTNTPNIFGNNNNSTSNSIFGNNNNSTSNSIFGNNNNKPNSIIGGSNTTTSNNIFSNNTQNILGSNNNNSTSIFGNTNNSNNNICTFGNTNNTSNNPGIFNNPNNSLTNQSSYMGGGNNIMMNNTYNNQGNQQMHFTLQGNNSLKYSKLNDILDTNQKNIVFGIEQTINNNEIILENNEGNLNDLDEAKKVLKQECTNLIKLSKYLSSTQKNCKLVVEGMEREFKDQVSQLQKAKKNFSLIENNSSVKIACPNEFLDAVLKELSIKIDSIQTRLLELESLVSMSDKDESDFNSKEDAIQATIMAAHAFLSNYQEESRKITELVKEIKIKYFKTMLSFGYTEKEIETRIKKYMDKVSVKNN